MAEGSAAASRPAIDLERSPREWLLGFLAGVPSITATQLERLRGLREDLSPGEIGALLDEGLIRRAPRLREKRLAYRISEAGLEAIGRAGLAPPLVLRRYREDLQVVWLLIAIRAGRLGAEVERVLTRHEMRLADATQADRSALPAPGLSLAVQTKAADPSFGVPLAGTGARHYPDATLVLAVGRVAVELMLTAPGEAELGARLDAYAVKPQLARTVLLVANAGLARRVDRVVRERGHGDRVTVGRTALASES